MATKKKPAKKKAAKKRQVASKSTPRLRFDPRQFTDPGPDSFRNLSAAVIKQLEQARNQFVKQIGSIVKGR